MDSSSHTEAPSIASETSSTIGRAPRPVVGEVGLFFPLRALRVLFPSFVSTDSGRAGCEEGSGELYAGLAGCLFLRGDLAGGAFCEASRSAADCRIVAEPETFPPRF